VVAETKVLARTKQHSLMKSIWRQLSQVYSIFVVLILWEVAARAIADPLFLPPLSTVFATLFDLAVSGELMRHVIPSAARALSGFVLAAVVGIALGLLMGWYKAWGDFWNSLISLSYPVPKIGLIPLFILWLGIGDSSKVAVIFAAAAFPIILNTYAGVKGVRKIIVWRAMTLGATRGEILSKVILPTTLPYIFVGLRLGMGIAWILLFSAEMIAANSGLGYLILNAEQKFETDVVFAALISIALLGYVFDRIILIASRRFCGWYFSEAATEAM